MNYPSRHLAVVLVRFAGLCFAYLALRQIISVILLALYFVDLYGYDLDGASIHDKIRFWHALPGTIEFLITAGTSYYLLRRGNWVIEFLCKDSTERPEKVEQDVDRNA